MADVWGGNISLYFGDGGYRNLYIIDLKTYICKAKCQVYQLEILKSNIQS